MQKEKSSSTKMEMTQLNYTRNRFKTQWHFGRNSCNDRLPIIKNNKKREEKKTWTIQWLSHTSYYKKI